MSTFRCFTRRTWQPARTRGWPDNYEPLATPMDRCRTVARFNTRSEAIAYCDRKNKKWRKYSERHYNGTLSAAKIPVYYLSPRYEWTEE